MDLTLTVRLDASAQALLENFLAALSDTRLAAMFPLAEPLAAVARVEPAPSPRADGPPPAAARPLPAPAEDADQERWSAERDALLRAIYPPGTPMTEMHARLNALPGALIGKEQIWSRVSAMGLRRRKPDPDAPPPSPSPAPASSHLGRMDAVGQVSRAIAAGPVRADFPTVARWAGERGIACRTRADLGAVNAKRRALGLPEFELPPIGTRR